MIILCALLLAWFFLDEHGAPIPWERHPDKALVRLHGGEWMSSPELMEILR